MSPVPTPAKSSSGPNAIPVPERQVLSSQTLRELRVACALIVRETGPSGAELEAILNQPDPLDTYNKEVAKVRAKASSTQQSALPTKGMRLKDRTSKSNLASTNQSSTTLPISHSHSNVYALKHKSTTALPQTKQKPEPAPLIKPVPAEKQYARKPVPGRDQEALAKIRSSMSLRPKTSAAASIDYVSATAGSSGSTTRSNTTFEPRISTNVTSYNQTPADDKRGSYQFPKRSSSRVKSAQGWRGEDGSSVHEPDRDLSQPNPDYVVPSLRHAKTAPATHSTSIESSRPRSRASSIKDSIIGGIREYIQPRPSLEALSRTASKNQSLSGSRSSSRPPSRASNFSQSSRGWLKSAANGLRRKGSFSSWKPNRPEDEDRGRGKNRGPDLNRSLPPLPGLDSYKEPKVHIAQMIVTSPSSTEVAAPQKTPATDRSANPWSPGHQSSIIPAFTDLQNCTQSFPRIPFSDDYPAEVPRSRVTSPRQATKSPQERQRREGERRRQRQERQREVPASDSQDVESKSRQEEEIRRVVRENIMRGGLSKEAFNSEEGVGHHAAPMQHPATSGTVNPAHRRPAESSKKRERHKKLERETKLESEEDFRHSRTANKNEKPQVTVSPKRTLRSRLSRLIRPDQGFEQGQGSAITAN